MSDLRSELDRIALDIAKHVSNIDCPFELKLDAFKVLSTYQLGLMRKKVTEERKSDVTTFNDLRRKIMAVESLTASSSSDQ